jgi:hypothetical protein
LNSINGGQGDLTAAVESAVSDERMASARLETKVGTHDDPYRFRVQVELFPTGSQGRLWPRQSRKCQPMSETLVWSTDFEIGIASVDGQHKHLVDLVSRLSN